MFPTASDNVPYMSRRTLDSQLTNGRGDEISIEGDPSSINSREGLEEQVSKELMETFGQDFRAQVEAEKELIEEVYERKARAGKEAGCVPSSPLSPSLKVGPKQFPRNDDGSWNLGL